MAKKQSLRTFLRTEVVKNRIRPPNPSKRAQLGIELEERSHFEQAEDSIVISDTDSLFGDPILSDEKTSERRLQGFLSQPSPAQSPVPLYSPSVPVNPYLQCLKGELKNLICLTNDANPREEELVRRQRAALIEEICRLEGETKADMAKEYKGTIPAL